MDDKLKRNIKSAIAFVPIFIWEVYLFLVTKLYEGSIFIDSKIDKPLQSFLRK